MDEYAMDHFRLTESKKLIFYYLKAAFVGFILAGCFWLFEVAMHCYFIHRHYHFMQEFWPNDINELWMRIFTSLLLLVFVMICARLLRSRLKITNQLQLAYAALNNIREAAMIVNANNEIVYVNPRYTTITGYLPEEVLGKNPNIVSSGKHNKRFYQSLWHKINKNGFWEGEIWNRRKTGEVFPEWITITTLKNTDSQVTNYIAIFSDISIRKASEEKMKENALHDPLTKLPNRRLFLERLNLAIKTAKRQKKSLAILFIDLDHFKLINDQHGHMVGDAFLVEVAHAIQSSLRETDTVARFGGDEFVILLPNVVEKEAVILLAKKLMNMLNKTIIAAGGVDLKPEISIGGAMYPQDAQTPESLISAADKAMYFVKENGRHSIKFYS
jgi:diguanylate cyclase (GGDEF)-like protein/PAS domain S-box-containing protein